MTLTEQWKKGELEEGWYYIEIDAPFEQRIKDISHYSLGSFDIDIDSNYITEVLAPVPSYEEYSRLEWYAGCGPDRIVELNKENRQLKEMLYKCREKLEWLNHGYDVWGGELTDFIEEIDEVLK